MKIAISLLQTGIRKNGVLLVHSSLKSMGYIAGGPETVIRALLEAIGPEGTLLIPALSYRYVHANQPVFNVLETPSNIGIIPEYFRTRRGSIRSIHPTHSVCGIGKYAHDILNYHHLDNTPCGANSPFRLLPEYEGQILFLGCGLRPNTSMHAVEELVETPYLFGDIVQYHIILPDKREMKMNCRRHGFKGFEQRYDRLSQLLTEQGMKTGKILSANIQLIESNQMWLKALNALRSNPFYFVGRTNASLT